MANLNNNNNNNSNNNPNHPLTQQMATQKSTLFRDHDIFAHKLLTCVIKSHPDQNVAICCASLSKTLVNLLQTVREEKSEEIRRALHLVDYTVDEIQEGFFQVEKMWNNVGHNVWIPFQGIWAQMFDEQFLESAKEQRLYCGTLSEQKERIPEIVEKNTQGRIAHVRVPPHRVDPLFSLYLDCTFFHGDWTLGFDPKKTRPGFFLNSKKQKVQVNYMTQTFMGNDIGWKQGEYYMALRLNLALNREVHCLIVLPNEHMSVETLLSKCPASRLKNICTQGDVSLFDVIVTLPQINLDCTFDLHDTFPDLGISTIFQEGSCEKLASQGSISQVVAKCTIQLNESGLAAQRRVAAAAPVTKAPRVEFKADRAFLLFVRNSSTNAILFAARVENPGVFSRSVAAVPPQEKKISDSPITNFFSKLF